MENTNFVAPQGAIQGSIDMTQMGGNQKTKRSDVQMLPHGPSIGVIYGFVDLGTQLESFDGRPAEEKRKFRMLIEHPQLKQLFYEEDTVRRSSATNVEATFFVNDKSNLKKIIDAITGKVNSVVDAQNFNLFSLLGQRIGVNIVHQPYKKEPTKFYEKVQSVMSANGLMVPQPFEPENKHLYFHIDKEGKNFLSVNFADLPNYLRKVIMDSKEAKAYALAGGKFAEHPKDSNTQAPIQQQAPQQTSAPAQVPVNNCPIIMIDTAYTREQYHASGWTDKALVDNGMAKWNTPATPPQAPAGPQGPPSAPAAPQAQTQQQAPVQQNAQPGGFLDGGDEESDLPF